MLRILHEARETNTTTANLKNNRNNQSALAFADIVHDNLHVLNLRAHQYQLYVKF